MDPADVLIIMDGGLAGAIACAMECERGLRVVAWQAPPGGPLSAPDQPPIESVRAAGLVRTQGELFGVAEILPGEAHGAETHPDPGALLLRAAHDASARGALRIIWPRACGRSVEEMFALTERADLVARLVALDRGAGASPALRIETPFVDLVHEQLLDLARDLEIPEAIWMARPAPSASPAPFAGAPFGARAAGDAAVA